MDELSDNLARIFWGGSSWGLLLELFFRTTVLYLYSLFLVRLIGKRGLSSLAPFELAVIVVLGSVLGGPMLDTKVPLIYGIVVLTVIVGLQRLFVHLTEYSSFLEHVLESDPTPLVKDGKILISELHKEGLSHEDLYLSYGTRELNISVK